MEVMSPYRISVNYRRGKFFIYNSILSALNNPKYICFYLSTEQRVLCIKGTDKRHKDCFNVEQFTNNKKNAFELNGSHFIKKFCQTIGWSLDRRHTVAGTLDEANRVIIFDLETEIEDEDDADFEGGGEVWQ